MLHPINYIPDRDRFWNIVNLQRDVLTFACDQNTPFPITKSALQNAFPPAIADWLWKRTRTGARLNQFGERLEAVVSYCQQNPGEGTKIINAFNHDIRFDQHLNDGNFTFQFIKLNLNRDIQEVVTSFMERFYDHFVQTGYPDFIHCGQGTFTRSDFVNEFYTSNSLLRVCPYCDGPPPQRTTQQIHVDVDHFFPKSEYPFFSMHPANLIPICLTCNQRVKRDKNPIDDYFNAPLVHSFHPYEKPARDKITVQISENDETAELHLEIHDMEHSHPSRRVQNLVRVLDLEERWLGQLRADFERLKNQILNIFAGIRRDPTNSQIQPQEILEDLIQRSEHNVGIESWGMLQVGYFHFVLNNPRVLDDLLPEPRS